MHTLHGAIKYSAFVFLEIANIFEEGKPAVFESSQYTLPTLASESGSIQRMLITYVQLLYATQQITCPQISTLILLLEKRDNINQGRVYRFKSIVRHYHRHTINQLTNGVGHDQMQHSSDML